jgi:5'-nucleotidase
MALSAMLKAGKCQPGLYINLLPIKGAVEAFKWLSEQPVFSVCVLTAPSIKNSHCYSEKTEGVEKYLGIVAVNYHSDMLPKLKCEVLLSTNISKR